MMGLIGKRFVVFCGAETARFRPLADLGSFFCHPVEMSHTVTRIPHARSKFVIGFRSLAGERVPATARSGGSAASRGWLRQRRFSPGTMDRRSVGHFQGTKVPKATSVRGKRPPDAQSRRTEWLQDRIAACLWPQSDYRIPIGAKSRHIRGEIPPAM